MTIKQYIQLEKLKDQFNNMAADYIIQHGQKIEEVKLIQTTFTNVKTQLNNLTKYFYEQ